MYEIKKLHVLSVAKLQAAIVISMYVIWSFLMIVIVLLSSEYSRRRFFQFDFDLGDFNILTLLGGLVISGIIGYAMGALASAVYNLVTNWTGGIKMDIVVSPGHKKNPDHSTPSPS